MIEPARTRAAASEVSPKTRWQNWSGRQQSLRPVEMVNPSTEQEFVDVVTRANSSGERVRAVGASHSHSRVAAPEELLVGTDNWQGVAQDPMLSSESDSADQNNAVIAVRSGTRIFQLGEPLWHYGLALRNQGDIDRQSLAGAIATGTHGSGRTLQNISASVVGVRLVLASGQIAECSAMDDPELFEVARHSLGSIGLITELKLAVRDRYRLEERLWSEDPDTVMERIGSLTELNRHFEYFWMPQRDLCACKTLNEVEPVRDSDQSLKIEPVEQHSKVHRIGWSHQIISTVREDLHTEMEFAVASDDGPACFAELRAMILQRFPELQWPLEYRIVAADDLAISAASGRETVTISVHQDISLDDRPLFEACEEVFRSYGGRPHWGKSHFHTGPELAALYDDFEGWWQTRDRFDPEGRFLNAHVESLRP